MQIHELKDKVLAYNNYFKEKPQFFINLHKDVDDGVIILDGPLRIHWGILSPIRLKIKEDSSRKSELNCFNLTQNVTKDEGCQLKDELDLINNTMINGAIDNGITLQNPVSRSKSSVVLRKKKSRPVKRRQSIINNHSFSTETSLFTPTYDSITQVQVSSLDSTNKVVKLLLDKFKVDNSSSEFCLCVIRSSGETRVLKENASPLVERVKYGPLEDDVKLFLIEKYRVVDIGEEVAYFLNLPDAVLEAFLVKYSMDQKLEKDLIIEKYHIYKEKLEELLEVKNPDLFSNP